LAIERYHINDFIARQQGLLLDVRSPGEFHHAHFPGSVSLPLFSDEERRVVGTAYKQESREKAIRIGLDFFGPKMRSMVETVEQLQPENKTVFLYCWRGGMRSGAVAWLLDLYGFKVKVLSGGYKAFRNWCLTGLGQPYQLSVLGGYTGSGKTETLKEMRSRGASVIDLEALANHKGSAFGRIGPQPSQEQFENSLALTLYHISRQSGTPVWIEDESQRIGSVNIPKPFWETMRRSALFFLDIPFEQRLLHILEEYGALDPVQLEESIQRISKRLGPLETKLSLQHIQAGELEAAFRILLRYYDKLYLKGLHNRKEVDSLLQRVEANRVSPENAQLLLTQPQTI
jgi:tRNA 2-selenouridine synthase